MPNGRCAVHGGKTPRGTASPNFKTGRYSKYLRGDLLAKFEESLSDESRLSLLEDISLTNARIAAGLENLDGVNLPELWIKLDDLRRRAEHGRVNKKTAIVEIMAMIERGATEARKWQEITSLQTHKRLLIESENKIQAVAERMVSVDELMVLVSQFVGIIRQHVNDKRALTAITSGIEKTVLGKPVSGIGPQA